MGSNTIAIVSEAEYLATSYEPDAEFEDDVLIERNLRERDHSWLQAALAAFLSTAASLGADDGVLRVEGSPIEVPLKKLEE